MLCHLGHMDIHQPAVPRRTLFFSVRAMMYYNALANFRFIFYRVNR